MSETTKAHHTSPASRPSPGDKPPAPAPPPPPAWRRWLLPIGLLLSLWLLFGEGLASLGGSVEQLSYTSFVQQVDAGKVKTADISSTGSVAGELQNGKLYQTAIPTALDDQQLAHRLERHNVQITAVPPSSGLGAIIVSLAPLLLGRPAGGRPARPDGRRAGRHRPVAGQGLRRRAAHHQVRRRRGIRRCQAGDRRGR
jgi:cell division protease FtsH